MAFACQLAGFDLMAKRDCCRCQQKVSFRLGNRALERRWCRRISCKSTSPSTLTTVYAISKSCKSYKSNASPRGIKALRGYVTHPSSSPISEHASKTFQNRLSDLPLSADSLDSYTYVFAMSNQERHSWVHQVRAFRIWLSWCWIDNWSTRVYQLYWTALFFMWLSCRVDAGIERFTQFAVAISGSGWLLPYQWSLSTPQRR